MVRTRRQRRSRHRRLQAAYLTSRTWLKQFKLVLVSPLLVTTLAFPFNQPSSQTQQSNAEPLGRFVPLAAHSPAWVPTLAQASIPVQITRHGNQVLLNGRRVSMPWSQQQQRLGIADAGLITELGLELLDSDSPMQQPVAWFSNPDKLDPDKPDPDRLALSTWLTQQYRYLDISRLQQQFGWQVEQRGESLQISTPVAKITGLRQETQPWGSRLVISLDQASPYQLTESQGELTLTLDAQIDPKTAEELATQPKAGGDHLKLEPSGSRSVLRLTHADNLRPQIKTLNHPNRLMVDLRTDAMVERNILWAPGLRWQQEWVSLGDSKFPVVGLEIDPRQSGLSLRPMLSGTGSSGTGNSSTENSSGTAPLATTTQRSQGIAAINGGFFNRNNRLPLGAIRRDSHWLSGPILGRGALGWSDAGDITVGRLSLKETLAAGSQQFVIQSTNSGYVGAGVARYTPDWGSSYSTIIDHETLLAVRSNQIVSQQPVAKAGQAVSIPSDGYLLVVRAADAALEQLTVGTHLELATQIQPDPFRRFAQVIGAGPLLIQDRQIVLDAQSEKFSASFIQEAAPRSVIATDPQGKLLLLTVHNRVNGAGPTLAEVAQVVQQLGAVNALNLDGGSSTTLYLGGQILNRLPNSTASVNNGIGVFIQP